MDENEVKHEIRKFITKGRKLGGIEDTLIPNLVKEGVISKGENLGDLTPKVTKENGYVYLKSNKYKEQVAKLRYAYFIETLYLKGSYLYLVKSTTGVGYYYNVKSYKLNESSEKRVSKEVNNLNKYGREVKTELSNKNIVTIKYILDSMSKSHKRLSFVDGVKLKEMMSYVNSIQQDCVLDNMRVEKLNSNATKIELKWIFIKKGNTNRSSNKVLYTVTEDLKVLDVKVNSKNPFLSNQQYINIFEILVK